MKKLPTRNWFYRNAWAADGYLSSAAYEAWASLRDWGSAYSSWLYRWFRLSGPKRLIIDLMDDGLTFLVAAIFALLAFALPPFNSTGDIWNRNRLYAVTFTDADGKLIGKRGISQNDSILLDDIPPVLINAVLATEDARFFDHFGVDVIGTLRAALRNTRGGSKQGGSSITQQVVKNLFLTPEKSLQRKVHEAMLSLWVEERRSKKEILKLYLDRSYLGAGTYGVEAASQYYFGKSVRDINLSEAAILAGLFKAPTQYAPHAHPEAARARANVVLYRMLDAGFITQGELLQAKRAPATIIQQDIQASPNWYLDWAYENTKEIMERQGLKNEYVVEVKTTIDRRLQDASQAILNDVIDNQGPTGLFTQGSSITMAPDGAVKAIVGGRDYEDSQYNRVFTAKRQVGSSFKPFVYLTALEKGYTPKTMVEDSPVCVGNWCVHNFNGSYGGNMTLLNAMTHSVNTIAVKLMLDVGGRKVVEATARRLGLTGQIDQYPTMAIGTSALTLLDISTGYGTIASGGKLTKPYAVLEIRRPNGDLIYSHGTNEKDSAQVVDPNKIAELTGMMHNVVMAGTAVRAKLDYAPVAGKTGTNANFRDAWFLGFSAHHVTGVWVGNDDNSPMNDTKEEGVTGGRVPAAAWKRIMDVAEFGLKPEGLHGVPIEGETWKPALTALTDPVLVGTVKGAVQGPVLPPVIPPDPDAVAPGEVTAEKADAQSRDVLNNMLDLFPDGAEPATPPARTASTQDTPHAQPARRASPPQQRQQRQQAQQEDEAPAPRPQRTQRTQRQAPRTIFDLLFGRNN